MAARYLPEDVASSVPRLPRGVFLSLLFTAIPLLKGWCQIAPDHIFFAIVLTLFCISSGAWLLAASVLQNTATAQRKENIERFISSEPGQEPPTHPHFEAFPAWLRLWEAVNILGYFFLLAPVIYSLFQLPRP